jgi:SPP1 gp7 family putative phage head morphogenesis protein
VISIVKEVGDIISDDEFWQEIETDLHLAMLKLNGRAIALGMEAASTIGVAVDMEAIHVPALQATRRATFDSIKKITGTTRDGLREALVSWQETGVVTPEQMRRGLPTLIEGIETLFGPERARRIAVTEVTNLFAQGNEEAGLVDETIGGFQVQTARDELVCPICAPLDGKVYPRGAYPASTGKRPSFHVHCRCGWVPVTWRYIRANRSKWQGDASAIPSREVWE